MEWQRWQANIWGASCGGGGDCGWKAVEFLMRATLNVQECNARLIAADTLPDLPDELVATFARRLYAEYPPVGNDISYRGLFQRSHSAMPAAHNFIVHTPLTRSSKTQRFGNVPGDYVYTRDTVAEAAPHSEWQAVAQLIASAVRGSADECTQAGGCRVAWFNETYAAVLAQSKLFRALDLNVAMMYEQPGGTGPLEESLAFVCPPPVSANYYLLIQTPNHWLAGALLHPDGTLLQLVIRPKQPTFQSPVITLLASQLA